MRDFAELAGIAIAWVVLNALCAALFVSPFLGLALLIQWALS